MLILYENFLQESLESLLPQFRRLTPTIALELLKYDPVPNKDDPKHEPGLYARTIFRLFNRLAKTIPVEDQLEEARLFGQKIMPLLKTYDNLKNDRFITNLPNNLDSCRSIDEIKDIIDGAKQITLNDMTRTQRNRVLRNSEDELRKICENNEWVIYKPETFGAMCTIGKNSNWCTAYSDSDAKYNDYMSSGPLFVIVNKYTKDKFLVSFARSEFKAADNKTDFEILSFLSNNREFIPYLENEDIFAKRYTRKIA